MINNNRQQNGRRRGRGGGGGQRPGGNPGRPEMGNRIDNRARGNAAQLLEKYKSLARDAQMQGDRVNTEYYLQFADHYFRVLSESRARFEETRRPNDDNGFDGDDDFDGDDGELRADQGQDRQRQERAQQRDRDDRGERQQVEGRRSGYNDNARDGGEPRRERFQRDRDDAPQEGVQAVEGEPARDAASPRRLRRPRAEAAEAGLDAAMLPPALGIGNDVAPEGDSEERPRPRRRGRPPASDIAEAS